jgi:hypothetical protein
MADDPRARTPLQLGPKVSTSWAFGQVPAGMLEAFQTFLESLSETMDVYRLVAVYDIGQAQLVHRGFLSDAASQRAVVRMLREAADQLETQFPLEPLIGDEKPEFQQTQPPFQ